MIRLALLRYVTILDFPLVELFIYFALYSFLGWVMETCYCSIKERRLVPRGFLYGPVCPIYGGGVVLMLLFFTPLKDNLALFYIVSVVVMTSWEYLVAWLLETTTHVKYWDYSNYKFNIKGRVCLWVALVWGVLSYVVIFWIQPQVDRLYDLIPYRVHFVLAGVILVLFLVDAAMTIHHLALVSRLVTSVTTLGEELQVQLALAKAELGDKVSEQVDALQDKYREQIAGLEKYSRRFRSRYADLKPTEGFKVNHEHIVEAAKKAREAIRNTGRFA